MIWKNYLKRIFDFLCALLGLFILSPVFIIIMFLIKITSKGPIFFSQERVGRYQKAFNIYKFRTMVANAESKGPQITTSGDSRITPIGNILRKTKIDELPQLYNVLIGDMSFVGPRPEVPFYVAKYDLNQLAVLDIRPGITDEASIEFRNESEILAQQNDPQSYYINTLIPRKIEHGLKYKDEASFSKDMLILFRTFLKLFN